MKILIISLGRRDAPPVYSLEMAKALQQEGNEVFCVVSETCENIKDWERNMPHLHKTPIYNCGKHLLLSFIWIFQIVKIFSFIRKSKPDVVFSPFQNYWDFLFFPLLAKYTRIKTIHDVELHEGEKTIVSRFLHYFIFRNAEYFVVLSSKYVQALQERGIDKKRIIVLPHAVFDTYADNAPSTSISNTAPTILFFGRIIKYKGLDILLKAMISVKEKYPNAVCRVVGKGDITPYAELITELGDTVELYNRHIEDDEIAGFVNDVSFVVLPYTHASQSGVIPLAYAFSKPVISTDVGCLSEQIVNGETGYIIEPNNVESLVKHICELLDDPTKVELMGRTANIYANTELTWESTARKLIKHINN